MVTLCLWSSVPRFAIQNLKQDVCLSCVCDLLVIMRNSFFLRMKCVYKLPFVVKNIGLYAIIAKAYLLRFV